MSALLLSSYILVWPVVCSVILAVLVMAVVRDYRAARRNGEDVV